MRVALAVALLVAGAPAWARQAPGAKPDKPQMYVDFGWSGKVPTERWSPMTVWITAGEKPIGGVLLVEFTQDATQAARIVVPFAATPGERTPVQVVAALPRDCRDLEFTLLGDRGRELARLTYAGWGASDTEAPMPPLLDPTTGLLVGLGRTSLHESVREWTGASGGDRPARPQDRWFPGMVERGRSSEPTEADKRRAWNNVTSAVVEPAVMPLTWAAYDGVMALVVEAGTAPAMNVRALEAVREWVDGGGRLVIVADSPGGAWRAWLPQDERGELVQLSPPEVGTLPPECGAAIRNEDRYVLALLPDEEPEGVVGPSRAAPMPAPAATITRRLVTLTDRARDDGWSVRWTEAPDAASGALAEGPVGFGWVTIIGLEPRFASEHLSARASGAVWRDAMGETVGDWLRSNSATQRLSVFFGYGPQTGSEHTISSLLEQEGVSGPRDGIVFLAIAACMMLLALLVGPVDYFVLKRMQAGQRSWLTALLWIGAASAAAYAAPIVLRSGPNTVSRHRVTDVIVDGSGAIPAWSSGLTSVFASQSGQAEFAQPDQASWWRGVSSLAFFAGSQPRLSGTVTTTQDAAGGVYGSRRGNPLEKLPIGMWTIRSFLDRSQESATVGATVAREAGGWRVEVTDLPEGHGVSAAALRIGESWYDLGGTGAATGARGVWSALAADSLQTTSAPAAWSFALPGEEGLGAETRPTRDARAGLAAQLPGASERALAIERRCRAGRWAAVYLGVEGAPGDVTIRDWTTTYHGAAVYRLLVPIDEGEEAP